MQTLFKLAYGLAVAILFVLFVILGTRTFYDEPEAPTFPNIRPPAKAAPVCDFQTGVCRDSNTGRVLTSDEVAKGLTESDKFEKESREAQREYDRKYKAYREDRADYHRNVFVLASILGVAAVAGGLYLFRRVEAMPLGLLLGGIGVVIFGWVQSADDFGEMGTAPLFGVVAAGLAVILAAGYRFLGLVRPGADGD